MTYWALSHSRWRAAAPSPRMFLSQTWDGWPKSIKARLKKKTPPTTTAFSTIISCSSLCVLARATSERRDKFSSSRSLSFLWSVSLTKPPEAASALFFLHVNTKKKTRDSWFRRRGWKEKRGTDEQMIRIKRSRRRAAGLVLALLGCVGVKLQQLILQVQLVVQLGHLQVTDRISCCDCTTGNKLGSSLLHVEWISVKVSKYNYKCTENVFLWKHSLPSFWFFFL